MIQGFKKRPFCKVSPVIIETFWLVQEGRHPEALEHIGIFTYSSTKVLQTMCLAELSVYLFPETIRSRIFTRQRFHCSEFTKWAKPCTTLTYKREHPLCNFGSYHCTCVPEQHYFVLIATLLLKTFYLAPYIRRVTYLTLIYRLNLPPQKFMYWFFFHFLFSWKLANQQITHIDKHQNHCT